MKNAQLFKNKALYALIYVSAAALLITLTLVCRKIDGSLFYNCEPFRPAEFIFEALTVAAASVYIIKHRETDLLKKVGKHIVFAVIPLVIIAAAFFYLPDKRLLSDNGLVYTLDSLLSSFADDFILCGLGCILLLHKGDMKIGGLAIMLLCGAAYGVFLADEHTLPALSALNAVIILFFEIELHMGTGSALFCGSFHFLMHMALHFCALHSVKSEPFVGNSASVILYVGSLLLMTVIGAVLYIKRRRREIKNKE